MKERRENVRTEKIEKEKIEKEIDKIDVIIGGPPCQAYSLVGRAQSSHMIVPMEDDQEMNCIKCMFNFLKSISQECLCLRT